MTLAEVKHRRELLFAAMPCLFALHQFTEGFVWLGLNGTLPAIVTHDAGAAYILYAQGLLPFLLPWRQPAVRYSFPGFASWFCWVGSILQGC